MTIEVKGPFPGHGNGPLELSSCSGVEVQANIPNEAQAQDKFRNPHIVREARLRLRRQRLVEHLHSLGLPALGHFIREIEVATGVDATPRLETYARIDHAFVRILGGNRFAPPFLHAIEAAE